MRHGANASSVGPSHSLETPHKTGFAHAPRLPPPGVEDLWLLFPLALLSWRGRPVLCDLRLVRPSQLRCHPLIIMSFHFHQCATRFIRLPFLTQRQIMSCMGALSLHLGSRRDSTPTPVCPEFNVVAV